MEAVSLHQELTLCRLKDAIEVIDAGFALWDAEDRVILSNSRYKCMFSEIDDLILQGAAFETILDRHYRQLQLKYPGVDLTEGRAERLRAHRECGTAVVRMPDGTWLQCDDRRTSEGGRVSLRTNITLMKQREEDLVALARDAEYQAVDLARMAEDLGQALQREKQATLEAESANTAKSRFLATMSHELRTPLNAIIGFAEIIKDHVLGNAMSDRYFDYAADIHSSGTHLLNIINTILDLSKVEAGSLNLDRTMVDLPQMINRCCKLVSSAAEAKEISITVRDLQATPFVYADAQSLRQILLNVFSNAIKFTPMNGRVGIAAEPSDGGWVVIRISDTGPGIPESEIPRLFEPFERMEDDHAGEASGTGLGLPIVRRLMELHGGTADLESTLAVGTTVVLRFPGPRADPAAAGPVIADPQKTV
jgi:two-component system cell cycle sensor histidine kinase PleC